jgi:ABC-2 type transport system permease protein
MEKWLTDKGEMKNARIMPEDLSHAIIFKQEDQEMNEHDGESIDVSRINGLVEQGKALKITDKEQLDSILRNYNSGMADQAYLVALFYEGQEYPEIGRIDQNAAPEFLKGF